MKLFVHIGMGKTGSTSIQSGLEKNPEILSSCGYTYLGPWFDILSDEYKGRANQVNFFAKSPSELVLLAGQFKDALQDLATTSNSSNYIISNESLWGQVETTGPFFQTLLETMDVYFIAYVRNAYNWLPSAYSQWGIAHKTYSGQIQPFEVRARHLVKSYREVMRWKNTYGDNVSFRDYDVVDDVFNDFLDVIGIDKKISVRRLHGRRNDAQLAIRFILNNRYQEPAEPGLFNDVVQSKGNKVIPLETIFEKYLNFNNTQTIIDEQGDLFEKIFKCTGINVVENPNLNEERSVKSIDKVRLDLLDYLLDVVVTLAQRVSKLENNDLRDEL